MSETIEMEVKGLDQLLKALKARAPIARVGILGDKTNRSTVPSEISHASLMKQKTAAKGAKQNTITNAEVGAAHEFGTTKIPQRSFLRIPISDNLESYMEKSDAFNRKVLVDVVKSGSVLPWLKKVAVLAETIVQDAFDSGGFGKWVPWKTKGYENNTGMLLVDSQQLRNSITSEVKEA